MGQGYINYRPTWSVRWAHNPKVGGNRAKTIAEFKSASRY